MLPSPIIIPLLLFLLVAALLLWWQERRIRRRHEEAEASRREAERRIAERIARTERELEQAAGAFRTQRDLLNLVGREVRGALDAILGSARLLLDTQLQLAQRSQLATLKAAGEALLYTLNDVQSVCETEAGESEAAEVDLRGEAARAFEVLIPRAALKQVEMVLLIEPDLPRLVQGDKARLRRFLFNLAAAALRLAGPGHLVLKAARSAAVGSPGANGRLWLRFSALVGNPAARETEGGESPFLIHDHMPLVFARRLAEVLGGRHGEECSPERGIELWFELPAGAELPAAAAASAPKLRDVHLVVWDDLPAARLAATYLLGGMGVSHEIAKSASDAVEALKSALEEHEGDVLLLLDESQPAAEMAELAAAFAARPVMQPVKLVLLSLRPAKATVEAGLPVYGILQKPLLWPEELGHAVAVARAATSLATVTEHTFSQFPFAGVKARTGPALLLVEDDEISRQVNSIMLRRLGYQVESATDGIEAVTLAKRRRYALILMDCRLPRLDGLRTAGRIRAMLGRAAPPIIALTAENSQSARRQALEAGMSDFLTKPATRDDFTRVLEKWIVPEQRPAAEQS